MSYEFCRLILYFIKSIKIFSKKYKVGLIIVYYTYRIMRRFYYIRMLFCCAHKLAQQSLILRRMYGERIGIETRQIATEIETKALSQNNLSIAVDYNLYIYR